MKTCPICNTPTADDTVVCLNCLHNFAEGAEQPLRYFVNRDLLTKENVASLCLAFMCDQGDRYFRLDDLWHDLEEAMRGSHVIDYGENMGNSIFAVRRLSSTGH